MIGGTAESQRPMYRDHLDERGPETEEQRVFVGALDGSVLPRIHPDPRARSDHRREDRLRGDVPQSVDSICCVSSGPPWGWKARVDRALQPWHVQEHVDGDDHDQDAEKSRSTTEITAPWANVIPSCA